MTDEVEAKAEEQLEDKPAEEPEAKAEAKTEEKPEPDPEEKLEEKAEAEPEAETAAEPEAPKEPPPIMTKIRPVAGPLGGGTRVVVEGSGFATGCTVKVDGVPVTAHRESDDELSFTTLPRNLAGRVDVDVANPDGQRTMLLRAFEYCTGPALASVAPDHAPETGGVLVTLTGTDLREGSEVRIGASRPRVDWRGPTRIDLEIAAHPAGTFDIELTSPDGQEARLPAAFRFLGAPRVDRVVPDHGPLGASTRVTVEGDGFRAGCSVYVGGERVPADLESATRIVATVPAREAPGPLTLRVQNTDGLGGELREGFRVDPAAGPRIALAVPSRVARGREHAVALTGGGFAEGCSVRIAGEVVPSRRVSDDRIELTLPAFDRIGFVDAEVRNLDGQAHRLDEAFELRGGPQLTAVQPREGSEAGGQYVQLVGLAFERGCEVTLGGFPAKTEWESEASVRAVVPARAEGAGTVDVLVRNPDGQSATLHGAFTYLARRVPVITSLEPTNGPTTGGTGVLLRGEHLDAVTQVLVGGVPALNFKARGGELAFVTPPRARDGAADLELRAQGGASTVRKNAFHYAPVPPPAIRSLSPNRGGVGGGTEVTIAGDNFFAGSQVLVAGETVATVKVRDKGTIVFKTPPGEAGVMVDVTVRSAAGQEAVAKRAFLYDPRYA
jgi:hypothetical protein